MAMLKCSAKGGGSTIDPSQAYSPTTSEGQIQSVAIPVTSGKTYAVVGLMENSGKNNTYSVSGGEILGEAFYSAAYAQYSSFPVITAMLIIRATASSMTISIPSGSSRALYSGQAVQLD